MTLPVVFRREATEDAESISAGLNGATAGLGDKFVARLNEKLQLIADHPELFAFVWQSVRGTKLKQFTYVVYYRLHIDRIEVLAIVHGSRDSSTWKSRV